MRARAMTMAGMLATLASALAVALAVALAGCGSSHAGARRTGASSPPQAVQFLARGVRTLAAGTLPGRGRFTIVAQHYRFTGRTYLNFSVTTRGGAGSGFTPAQTPGPLAFADFGECSHPSMLLVYGLLRATRDRVTLSANGIARPLARAAIPADLHAGGVLVYALTSTPAKLAVKSAAGRVLKSARVTGGSRRVCSSPSATFSTLALMR
ncbi:MAG TPA: hypothetical protein VG388_03570 [Solirubrobacteraceae bacterium]|nr:hypothetical protein [Solirubrobacteraceae bacterium]